MSTKDFKTLFSESDWSYGDLLDHHFNSDRPCTEDDEAQYAWVSFKLKIT